MYNLPITEKKYTLADLIRLGYSVGSATTSYYRNLPSENQQPFYLDSTNNRYRVHHGLAGAILSCICLIGMCSEDNSIKELSAVGFGIGTALVEDDISDIDRWIPDLLALSYP